MLDDYKCCDTCVHFRPIVENDPCDECLESGCKYSKWKQNTVYEVTLTYVECYGEGADGKPLYLSVTKPIRVGLFKDKIKALASFGKNKESLPDAIAYTGEAYNIKTEKSNIIKEYFVSEVPVE